MISLRLLIVTIAFAMSLSGCDTDAHVKKLEKENADLKIMLSNEKTLTTLLRKDVLLMNGTIEMLRSEVHELKFGADVYFKKGVDFFKKNRLDDAMSNFEAIIEKYPSSNLIADIQKYIKKIHKIESDKKAAEKARVESSLKAMKKKYDKVEGVTWYTPRKLLGDFGESKSPIIVYIGQKNNHSWLRFKLFYEADEWLFAKRAVIYIDGENYDVLIGGFERDHGSGRIWEWSDVVLENDHRELVEKIIKSKEAIVRFYGTQYYGDKKITKKEKQGLQEALDAFSVLNRM